MRASLVVPRGYWGEYNAAAGASALLCSLRMNKLSKFKLSNWLTLPRRRAIVMDDLGALYASRKYIALRCKVAFSTPATERCVIYARMRAVTAGGRQKSGRSNPIESEWEEHHPLTRTLVSGAQKRCLGFEWFVNNVRVKNEFHNTFAHLLVRDVLISGPVRSVPRARCLESARAMTPHNSSSKLTFAYTAHSDTCSHSSFADLHGDWGKIFYYANFCSINNCCSVVLWGLFTLR